MKYFISNGYKKYLNSSKESDQMNTKETNETEERQQGVENILKGSEATAKENCGVTTRRMAGMAAEGVKIKKPDAKDTLSKEGKGNNHNQPNEETGKKRKRGQKESESNSAKKAKKETRVEPNSAKKVDKKEAAKKESGAEPNSAKKVEKRVSTKKESNNKIGLFQNASESDSSDSSSSN